jgi:hypothetical protein
MSRVGQHPSCTHMISITSTARAAACSITGRAGDIIPGCTGVQTTLFSGRFYAAFCVTGVVFDPSAEHALYVASGLTETCLPCHVTA